MKENMIVLTVIVFLLSMVAGASVVDNGTHSEINGTGSAWFFVGSILSSFHDYSDSAKAFDKAIESNPNDGLAWFNKGKALYFDGQYNESIRVLQKAIDIDADLSVKAWFYQGNAYFQLGNYTAADRTYTKAINLLESLNRTEISSETIGKISYEG